MKHFLLVTLLFCLSLPIACTKSSETTQAAKEERTLTDSDLKDQIEAKLNSEPDLRAANLSVSADVKRNMATLSGTVQSEAMRAKAVDMAKAVHPGLTVEDKIDVKPRELSRSEYTPEQARQEVERAEAKKETVGGTLDDAWIHAKIVSKLITDQETLERKINVDVNNNVVTLRGTVRTLQEKQEAEKVAKETEGVKSVINQLKVAKG